MRRLFPQAADVTGAAALEADYELAPARHLRANFVTSLDGMVEVGGRSSALGGPDDRKAFMAMRAVADVILVGAGTVHAEQYGPVVLDPSVRDRRRSRHQTDLPRLAIVSKNADLDPAAKFFSGTAKPLLITTAAAAAAHVDLAAVAEIIVCGDHEVDLAFALNELFGQDLLRVLCEGGPTLLRSLIDAGLLDELCLTSSARLVGPGHRSLLGGQPLTDVVFLRLTNLIEGEGMLLARYCCERNK